MRSPGERREARDRFTTGMLTGLATARHIGFPRVMRLVAWLSEPAVRFTRPRSH
jgi:hypothetical protein